MLQYSNLIDKSDQRKIVIARRNAAVIERVVDMTEGAAERISGVHGVPLIASAGNPASSVSNVSFLDPRTPVRALAVGTEGLGNAYSGGFSVGAAVARNSAPKTKRNAPWFSLHGTQQFMENAVVKQQMDIRVLHNICMDATVASCVFGNNLLAQSVGSESFAYMINRAKYMNSHYKLPGRSQMNRPLMKVTYNQTMEDNKKMFLGNVGACGLSVQSDGATVAGTALINVIGNSVLTSPVCLAIVDATAHLAAGGKKSAT